TLFRSPQTTGVDWPAPLSGVFHSTDSSVHFWGRSFSVEWPSAVGPRQPGHEEGGGDVWASSAIASNRVTTLLRPACNPRRGNPLRSDDDQDAHGPAPGASRTRRRL